MTDYLKEETTFNEKILSGFPNEDFKKNLEFRRWLILLAVSTLM